jgi:hypothetical protein
LVKEGIPAVLGDCKGEPRYDSDSVAGDLGDAGNSTVGGRIVSGDKCGLKLPAAAEDVGGLAKHLPNTSSGGESRAVMGEYVDIVLIDGSGGG